MNGMDERRKEFLTMLEVFFACVQSLEGKSIPLGNGWKNDIQHLASKLFCHLGTLFHLQEGTSLPEMLGIKPEYVDFPSVAIIARSVFETYLTTHYIFFEPDNDEIRAFRHKLWVLGGLFDRQKFLVTTSAGKMKIDEEKELISKIKTEIIQHQIYLQLPSEHQKEAIKGKWRLKQKWEDLAVLADQHKGFFISIYALLCSHAHASYLGVLQLSQAVDHESRKRTHKNLHPHRTYINEPLHKTLLFAF